jgi:hypothetical protein
MLTPGLRTFLLLLIAAACPAIAGAANSNLARYPLRIHVLALDETHQGQRMSPAASVVCDAIDDMLSSVDPSPAGPISVSGVSSDPCSLHADSIGGNLLDISNTIRVFSGAGRADLVSPPDGTQGFTFRYSDCARVRVLPGFQSLPARWKKPGQTLQVLVPSDDIPDAHGRTLPPVRCTFSVSLHPFVYLLLRNGTLIEISQQDYWKKPALRVLLSGYAPTVQQRLQQFTVPVSAEPSQHPMQPR